MAKAQDPSDAIRKKAASFPDVTSGTSCKQDAFKVGGKPFLYVGPGAKGVGFKAMFKLKSSMAQAKKNATEKPDRFEVGSTGWVTTRFTAEKPLPKSIWEKWLKESYELTIGSGARKSGKAGKKAASKKTTKKMNKR